MKPLKFLILASSLILLSGCGTMRFGNVDPAPESDNWSRAFLESYVPVNHRLFSSDPAILGHWHGR
jgi:hypothetical protein